MQFQLSSPSSTGSAHTDSSSCSSVKTVPAHPCLHKAIQVTDGRSHINAPDGLHQLKMIAITYLDLVLIRLGSDSLDVYYKIGWRLVSSCWSTLDQVVDKVNVLVCYLHVSSAIFSSLLRQNWHCWNWLRWRKIRTLIWRKKRAELMTFWG